MYATEESLNIGDIQYFGENYNIELKKYFSIYAAQTIKKNTQQKYQ